MAIRSFLAFELPPVLKEGIEETHRAIRPKISDVRWVTPANVHLTVVFLGSVPPGDIDRIGSAAGAVCSRYGPFSLALNGLGTFGGRRRPRVLWVGLVGDVERMGGFRDALQKELGSLCAKPETRPFRPHLTLGRFKDHARPGRELEDCLEEKAGLTSAVVDLNELVLFRSDLKPGGAVYTRLGSWPLFGSK